MAETATVIRVIYDSTLFRATGAGVMLSTGVLIEMPRSIAQTMMGRTVSNPPTTSQYLPQPYSPEQKIGEVSQSVNQSDPSGQQYGKDLPEIPSRPPDADISGWLNEYRKNINAWEAKEFGPTIGQREADEAAIFGIRDPDAIERERAKIVGGSGPSSLPQTQSEAQAHLDRLISTPGSERPFSGAPTPSGSLPPLARQTAESEPVQFVEAVRHKSPWYTSFPTYWTVKLSNGKEIKMDKAQAENLKGKWVPGTAIQDFSTDNEGNLMTRYGKKNEYEGITRFGVYDSKEEAQTPTVSPPTQGQPVQFVEAVRHKGPIGKGKTYWTAKLSTGVEIRMDKEQAERLVGKWTLYSPPTVDAANATPWAATREQLNKEGIYDTFDKALSRTDPNTVETATAPPPATPTPSPTLPPQPSTGGGYDYKKAYDFQASKGWLYPGETMESFKTDMDAALANVAALSPDEQQKLWENEKAVGRTTQNFQEWYNSMPKPWTPPQTGGGESTMGERAGAQKIWEQEQFNPLTLMLVERLRNYLPQLQASRARVLAGESPELGPYYRPEPLGGRTNFRGGGVVPGPMGAPRRITAHGGEIVIDPMAKLTDAILTHIMRGA